MDKFVLVIGNSRSGTTIVGSIIDSHPQMLCANESTASQVFWRDRTRASILEEIRVNSAANLATGRPSEGYTYAIEMSEKADIAVYGDKIWNPALLLLAGDRHLVDRLGETLGAPIVFVLCVRNPFDVIATMRRRSGASIEDRIRWFFMHCDAALSLWQRDLPLHPLRSEALIEDAAGVSASLFEWLGYGVTEGHLRNIRGVVSAKPNKARDALEWPKECIAEIEARAAQYPFLAGYSFDQ